MVLHVLCLSKQKFKYHTFWGLLHSVEKFLVCDKNKLFTTKNMKSKENIDAKSSLKDSIINHSVCMCVMEILDIKSSLSRCHSDLELYKFTCYANIVIIEMSNFICLSNCCSGKIKNRCSRIL